MHKNRRLFDLATRNSQRQVLAAFVASHPLFHHVFALEQSIFHPELSGRLGPTIHRALASLDNKCSDLNDTITFKSSSRERAMSCLTSWFCDLPAGRYVVVLGENNGIKFEGELYWVSEMPGLCVALPEQQRELLELVVISNAVCVVSALDCDAGIYSDAISGWLPDEPSASEVVFEIAGWGFTGEG